jgi:hypothetical protein
MMMAGPGAFRDFTPLRLTPFGFQCDQIIDPGDLDSTWQDSAGTTTRAQADNDPVGFVRDRSGRGRNATQSTSGKRPLLKVESGIWFLRYDGTDDDMSVSVPKGTSWFASMAYRKAASSGRGVYLASSNNSTQPPICDQTTSRLQTMRGTGTSAGQQYQAAAASGGKTTWAVASAWCDNDGSNGIRLNKTDQGALTSTGSAFTPQATWNLCGGRVSASSFSAMDLAFACILPRVPSTEEMDIIDSYLMARVGL